MAKSVESKREREKKIVSQMIEIYCRKNHGAGNHGTDKHGAKNALCKECQELKDYALLRSDKCPFMESKTFCSNCKVHCYRKDMREKIKEVMRFSGPRMIFHHPVAAISHVIESKKEKRRIERERDEY